MAKGISVRGRSDDIATSRAFIPPWSLGTALETKVGDETGLLSDQASGTELKPASSCAATGTLAILR